MMMIMMEGEGDEDRIDELYRIKMDTAEAFLMNNIQQRDRV